MSCTTTIRAVGTPVPTTGPQTELPLITTDNDSTPSDPLLVPSLLLPLHNQKTPTVCLMMVKQPNVVVFT